MDMKGLASFQRGEKSRWSGFSRDGQRNETVAHGKRFLLLALQCCTYTPTTNCGSVPGHRIHRGLCSLRKERSSSTPHTFCIKHKTQLFRLSLFCVCQDPLVFKEQLPRQLLKRRGGGIMNPSHLALLFSFDDPLVKFRNRVWLAEEMP